MTRFFSRITLASTTALLLAPAAFAFTADDLIAALERGMNLPEGAITAANQQVSGDDLLLENVTLIDKTAINDIGPVPVGDMRFENISQTDNGSFLIESAQMDAFAIVMEEVEIRIGQLAAQNLYLPADKFAAGELPFIRYDTMTGAQSSILIGGNPVAQIAEFGAMLDTGTLPELTGESYVRNLSVTLPAEMTQESSDLLDALQLQDINADLSASFYWNTQTGVARAENYVVDVNNVGRLAVELGVGGYNLETAQAFAELSEAAPSSETEQNMAMLQGFLEQLGGLTLSDAKISFTDAGVTMRALDYFGKKQGGDGAQMAAMLPMIAGMGLAGLNLPEELMTQITGSLTTYLGDPDNVTIAALPDAPVGFMDIINTASSAPQTLPVLLNLSVSANQ